MSGRFRSGSVPTRSRRRTVGAVLWILQPLCIVAELIAVSQVRTPYSMMDSTMSEAGASTCRTIVYAAGSVPVCSPLGWLMNAATVASGVAVIIGVFLLRPWMPAGWVRACATILTVFSGLSMVGTGIVPVDLDLNLHILVAVPQFLTFPLMLLLIGMVVRKQSRVAAFAGLLGGIICLAGALAFMLRLNEPHGGGLLERIALWPWFLTLSVLGYSLFRVIRHSRTVSTEHALPARKPHL
ncbi:DUF998 domain-containing protein [Brevibacterium marinum]